MWRKSLSPKIANGLQGSLFSVLILAHEAASRLFKKRKFGLSTGSVCIVGSVDRPSFRVSLPHRRSTTVSLETNPFTRPSFVDQLRNVWISDETLFQVFDIPSQSTDNSWRKSKQKFTEFYDN